MSILDTPFGYVMRAAESLERFEQRLLTDPEFRKRPDSEHLLQDNERSAKMVLELPQLEPLSLYCDRKYGMPFRAPALRRLRADLCDGYSKTVSELEAMSIGDVITLTQDLGAGLTESRDRWLTVTDAAKLFLQEMETADLADDVTLKKAVARISKACGSGKLRTNGLKGLNRRVHVDSVKAYAIDQRDELLNEEDDRVRRLREGR